MTEFELPVVRPRWFAWAQAALFALWIPILLLIPFHGDYEAVTLLAIAFVGGAALGWIDQRWREEDAVQIWVHAFERVFRFSRCGSWRSGCGATNGNPSRWP